MSQRTLRPLLRRSKRLAQLVSPKTPLKKVPVKGRKSPNQNKRVLLSNQIHKSVVNSPSSIKKQSISFTPIISEHNAEQKFKKKDGNEIRKRQGLQLKSKRKIYSNFECLEDNKTTASENIAVNKETVVSKKQTHVSKKDCSCRKRKSGCKHSTTEAILRLEKLSFDYGDYPLCLERAHNERLKSLRSSSKFDSLLDLNNSSDLQPSFASSCKLFLKSVSSKNSSEKISAQRNASSKQNKGVSPNNQIHKLVNSPSSFAKKQNISSTPIILEYNADHKLKNSDGNVVGKIRKLNLQSNLEYSSKLECPKDDKTKASENIASNKKTALSKKKTVLPRIYNPRKRKSSTEPVVVIEKLSFDHGDNALHRRKAPNRNSKSGSSSNFNSSLDPENSAELLQSFASNCSNKVRHVPYDDLLFVKRPPKKVLKKNSSSGQVCNFHSTLSTPFKSPVEKSVLKSKYDNGLANISSISNSLELLSKASNASKKIPSKKTLKHKRWVHNEIIARNLGHEDDLLENIVFSPLRNMFEFDTESELSFNIGTPKCGFQLSPTVPKKTPVFKDCYSPEELKISRKNAEQFIYRNDKKKQSLSNNSIVSNTSKNSNVPDESHKKLDVVKLLSSMNKQKKTAKALGGEFLSDQEDNSSSEESD